MLQNDTPQDNYDAARAHANRKKAEERIRSEYEGTRQSQQQENDEDDRKKWHRRFLKFSAIAIGAAIALAVYVTNSPKKSVDSVVVDETQTHPKPNPEDTVKDPIPADIAQPDPKILKTVGLPLFKRIPLTDLKQLSIFESRTETQVFLNDNASNQILNNTLRYFNGLIKKCTKENQPNHRDTIHFLSVKHANNKYYLSYANIKEGKLAGTASMFNSARLGQGIS